MNDRDGALVLPAALGSGAIALAFLPVQWLTRPPAVAPTLIALDAAMGLGMLCIALVAWRMPSARGSAMLGTLTLMSLVTTVATLVLVGDPAETMYLVLLTLASGALLLSRPWLGVVLAGTLAGFAYAAWLHGAAAWTTQGSILFVSAAVAVLIQTLRRRAVVRDRAMTLATRESEERYRALVENAPDAIIVARGGRWIFVNDAAVGLFGAQSREELLESDASIRLVDHGDDKLGIRLDGLTVPVEVVDLPISWGSAPAVQSIVRDLSARHAAEAEKREVERLRELDAVKTRFLNSVSHELRTPLTPIRVQLHIMRHPSASAEAKQKAMSIVDRNVARMAGLVEDLLEVARVDGGKLALQLAPLDMRTVLAEAMETFEAPAIEAGIGLSVEVSGALPVAGDSRRLTQVLYNLMGNALKFTPRGGRVHVDARQESGDIVVRVSDTGPGLAASDIARLFEPFSQAHDTMQQTHAGTGLGLYISRGLVEAHGGTIGCESAGPGRGSCFTFRIPASAPQPAC